MPLDQNLFVLAIKRSEVEPQAIDLVDPQGTIHYRRRPYQPPKNAPKDATLQPPDQLSQPSFELYDPLSDGLLASLSLNPSTANKRRVIELHNPSAVVDLTFTGTIGFRWQFEWENHTFEYKKGECFLVRKPDPPVLVAVWELDKKQRNGGSGETSTLGSVQILDYNLGRFDVDDRKGLEVILVTGVLSFQDVGVELGAGLGGKGSSSSQNVSSAANNMAPPAVRDIPAEIKFMQRQEKVAPNEVVITPDFTIQEFAEYAANLLVDPKMLYIIIKSKSEAEVQKVVAIAEETKRLRYRGGAYDEELHQYVKYDEDKDGAKKNGPRVIKLDGPGNKESGSKDYRPPTTLTIHLSKIPMPELQPKATSSNALRPGGGSKGSARPVSMHLPSSISALPPFRNRKSSPSPPRSSGKLNKRPNTSTGTGAPASAAGSSSVPINQPGRNPTPPRTGAANAPVGNSTNTSTSSGVGRLFGFSRPSAPTAVPPPSIHMPPQPQRGPSSPMVPGSYPSPSTAPPPFFPPPSNHAPPYHHPSSSPPPGYTPRGAAASANPAWARPPTHSSQSQQHPPQHQPNSSGSSSSGISAFINNFGSSSGRLNQGNGSSSSTTPTSLVNSLSTGLYDRLTQRR